MKTVFEIQSKPQPVNYPDKIPIIVVVYDCGDSYPYLICWDFDEEEDQDVYMVIDLLDGQTMSKATTLKKAFDNAIEDADDYKIIDKVVLS